MHLAGVPGAYLLENLGYTFGFVIVIMARQQLFTENTVTAVLPVMHKPTGGNFMLLLRLWSVVLIGNLLVPRWARWRLIICRFSMTLRAGLHRHQRKVMEHTPGEMFANAVISGWIIATMVWMFPYAGGAKIVVIVMMTGWWRWAIWPTLWSDRLKCCIWCLPARCRGRSFVAVCTAHPAGQHHRRYADFALISHAQIRNDMSEAAKAKARAEQKRKERQEKQKDQEKA